MNLEHLVIKTLGDLVAVARQGVGAVQDVVKFRAISASMTAAQVATELLGSTGSDADKALLISLRKDAVFIAGTFVHGIAESLRPKEPAKH